EPLRIITGGLPDLAGATILERRRFMQAHLDHVRRALMWEPRGHYNMYGCVLTPPVTPGADLGVLFMHNEGYSTMCGHGVIALTTALIETGMFPAAGDAATIVYDAPAGTIRAHATLAADRVTAVAFRNVPAFVLARDLEIDVSAGRLRVDVAWGGAFYAIVDAAALGIPVRPERTADLTRAGMEIKRAVARAIDVVHPTEPDLSGLYGTIITDAPSGPGRDGRNVTIYAEGAVDRSPCGTGTSARLAHLFARGRLGVGVPYVHESLIGTTFIGTIVGETAFGGFPAVETEIAGRGFLTGLHQFVVDPDDPTAQGFLTR
ncbi:MAG TPA: proline racemase family protein, partial [Thermomicrobiales bacterium]|nr:proline racemase family protein [Thermomicrobiales bacterium]